jgi:antitoxin CptB
MENDQINRRKRIQFRSWHRGTREADLLLGRFADRHLETMTPAELDQFEAVLELPEPDLMAWYVGRATVPAEVRTPVLDAILDFKIYE